MKKVEYYVTEDGTKFETESEALEHEELLNSANRIFKSLDNAIKKWRKICSLQEDCSGKCPFFEMCEKKGYFGDSYNFYEIFGEEK